MTRPTFARCELFLSHEVEGPFFLFSNALNNCFLPRCVAQITAEGSTGTLPFAILGSGSLAAMAVLETKYREGLTVS